ncbi:MAG TPA: DUF1538 domain-containing protein, partial [Eubacteriaceae bacterium]|nr:DUF1538 domain-containing protein [Eubacteriaceae bacterium]
MNLLSEKLKETAIALIPVVFIVFAIHLALVPLETDLLVSFAIGALCILFGLSFFLVGIDLGITPLGSALGAAITKRGKLWIVVASGLTLGFFISFAEPGLFILAKEIETVTGGSVPGLTIMTVVSLGIAVMMVLGFFRILYNIPLHLILRFSYLLVFLLSFFIPPEFLAIAFDTSGATTGVLAVPFILALSLGVTHLKKDSKASEKDSFGLIAVTSVGAILSVMILNIFSENTSLTASIPEKSMEGLSPLEIFRGLIIPSIEESALAFLPLFVIFVLLVAVARPFKKRQIKRIAFGFFYSFIGLTLFFLGVNGGFMQVGQTMGSVLTLEGSYLPLVLVGFTLGVVTILAEPAVYVLTHQIEEVTAGYVKRSSVLVSLAVGVGLAIALSLIRILVPGIELWHYLLPGYLISLGLTFVVPRLFIGIAFDAGGVATGPMTATFILAFTNGAAGAYPGADP